MQVTETNSDGLKREFKVVVPLQQIEEKVQARLDELQRTATLPGFRPGKVPMTLLRKKYQPSAMAEVLENAVHDGA
ncbi:MAG: trigger factor, partial [Rhodospirillales bacterium]|nr:trigger factor [Rhodospirillales bacterium]